MSQSTILADREYKKEKLSESQIAQYESEILYLLLLDTFSFECCIELKLHSQKLWEKVYLKI